MLGGGGRSCSELPITLRLGPLTVDLVGRLLEYGLCPEEEEEGLAKA